MTKLTKDEARLEELRSRLEQLSDDYPEFMLFVSIFSRDGTISWTITEALCMACVIDWMVEIKESKQIKHLEDEMVH